MRTRRTSQRVLNLAVPLLSLLAFIVIWHVAVMLFDIAPFVLPPPSAVWEEIVEQLRDGLYVRHSLATIQAVLLGYLVATVAGVVLGIVMATWRMGYRILYPPIVASQGMPKVAVAPLILLWFGFGMTSKIIIAALIAFFPIVIATLHGMASVPPELIRLGRSMGLSRTRLFLRIQAPSALPEMFSGFKIGIALALIGAIVAEFVASNRGLGYLLISSMAQLNTATVMATLLILGLVGVMLYTAVDVIERLVIPWHVASGSRREALAA